MELLPTIDPEMDSFDKLMLLNRELFGMIENQVSIDLLTRLFSSQLITKGEKHMLDYNRAYYKIIRQIICEGQERGELRRDLSVNDIVREYKSITSSSNPAVAETILKVDPGAALYCVAKLY